jgi:NAD(P)H-hydrate epimerase
VERQACLVANRPPFGGNEFVSDSSPFCLHNVSRLICPENAAALDREAHCTWGLNPFALVEAAGRACADVLISNLDFSQKLFPKDFTQRCKGTELNPANPGYAPISPCFSATGFIVVCAGPGNNGADALVMLRSLLTAGFPVSGAAVLLSRFPLPTEESPRSLAVKALQALGVQLAAWNGPDHVAELFKDAALIIDGVAGTGIRGALEGIPLEMAAAVNKRRSMAQVCTIISVDVPSGVGSAWKPGMPVLKADYTLAIEPLKTVLFTPALRPFCGTIIPVTGVFPPQLLERYGDADLFCWEEQRALIPPLQKDAYKYTRGVAEIHAGSTGSVGAARIAAAGASAAGAGLVRLIVDDELYPILASSSGGVMVVPASCVNIVNKTTEYTEFHGEDEKETSPPCKADTCCLTGTGTRFGSDTLLLGPGWGRGRDRLAVLRKALETERSGTPLILDADGIALLKSLYPDLAGTNGERIFHRNAILTPHAGELEALSGIPKERLLSEPALITELAQRFNAVILFKSHVMIVADPDGTFGFIDGMDPFLAAGGSGDFLAGLCAGIAGRMRTIGSFDPYAVAAAAGTLLITASRRMGRRFYDPLELAVSAAILAGEAWLPEEARLVQSE